MRSEPFWWEGAAPTASSEAPLPDRVDVLVVGAGLTGLSAARAVARRGRSVLVLDAGAPGEGASSRNGGMIGGGHRLAPEQLSDRFGPRVAEGLLREAHLDSMAHALRVMGEERIDCAFRRTGRFRGLWRAPEYEAAARANDRLAKLIGVPAHMVPRAEQRAEAGTDLYAGGVVYPDHGGLDPARCVAGLHGAAMRAGATVQGRTPVTALAREGDGFEARTPRGRVSARDVLMATNGYAPAFAPARRRIVPIPSYIVATAPLPPETMRALSPKGRMVAESRERHCYYRPSPDGTRLIFGGRAAMFDAPEALVLREMRRLMAQVFPELGPVELTHSWRGRTGFTFDALPHVGRVDGVWHAMGYSGSGNAMAPWLGHKAGLLMAGDPEGATAFQHTPFGTRLWHVGPAWFLPAADALFRMRDIKANLGRDRA